MVYFFIDPGARAVEYKRIGQELIQLGQIGAGEWFLLAADQVDAIDLGFQGSSGVGVLVNNGGSGSIDAGVVVQSVSYELAAYNFQNYMDIKNGGSINGLEGLRGKDLATEMAGFEQEIAQGLLENSLGNYSARDRAEIVNNINE